MWLHCKKGLISLLRSFFFLFASARGYTILLLAIAQYLSARYILASHLNWWLIITDLNLFCLVLASSLAIAGGYLINNFYDAEKDRINRPQQYLIDHLLPVSQQLGFYLILNLASLFLALKVSQRALLFFLAYIGGIWLYSHFLKKTFWASNIFAAVLAITPFFAISLYVDNLSIWVMYHASFLFFIILIRDLVKDLKNFRGDWVRKYHTIAIRFGIKSTKWIITFLICFAFLSIFRLLRHDHMLGSMYYYFLSCIPYMFVFLFLLWSYTTRKAYLWLHNMLKILLLTGVFSIILVRYPL